jgi:hypothetical protein
VLPRLAPHPARIWLLRERVRAARGRPLPASPYIRQPPRKQGQAVPGRSGWCVGCEMLLTFRPPERWLVCVVPFPACMLLASAIRVAGRELAIIWLTRKQEQP